MKQIRVLQIGLQGVLEVLQLSALGFLVDCFGDFSGPVDEFHDLNEVLLLAASGGHGWTADSNARGNEGRFIARNCVFIDRNRNLVHDCFDSSAINAFAAHVSHEEMVVSSSRNDLVSLRQQELTCRLDVFDDLSKRWVTCCW